MRHELYSKVEGANLALVLACRAFYGKPAEAELRYWWPNKVDQLDAALKTFNDLRGETSLYGSEAVSGIMSDLWINALGIKIHWQQINDPDRERGEVVAAMIELAERCSEISKRLREAMRLELDVRD